MKATGRQYIEKFRGLIKVGTFQDVTVKQKFENLWHECLGWSKVMAFKFVVSKDCTNSCYVFKKSILSKISILILGFFCK